MVPSHIEMNVYGDLGKLPHFDDENYDLVNEWRKQIREADGILICTPEYAFGVPGTLKNALDWAVSTGDFYDKPVALITASSVGDKAHNSLQQTLTALTTMMTEESKLLLSHLYGQSLTNGENWMKPRYNQYKKC